MVNNFLLDTDIFINWLRGEPWERSLFLKTDARFYYSVLSRKELLTKKGLSTKERQKIETLLRWFRKVPLDPQIAPKAYFLQRKYAGRHLTAPDAIIAATAWSKNLILITHNVRHFSFIIEIRINQL